MSFAMASVHVYIAARKGAVWLLCWAFILSAPTLSQAQPAEKPIVVLLKNIPAVRIVVEDLDVAAVDCGLTDGMLDAAVRTELDRSRLRIDAEASAFIYVRVNVLPPINQQCRAAVDAEFLVVVRHSTLQEYAVASAVGYNEILNIPRTEFPSRVRDSVSEKVERLLSEWIRANPRR